MKNGVKATYVPLFATKRGSYNTGTAAYPMVVLYSGLGQMHLRRGPFFKKRQMFATPLLGVSTPSFLPYYIHHYLCDLCLEKNLNVLFLPYQI